MSRTNVPDAAMTPAKGGMTQWLARAPAGVMNTYAVITAFVAYFCVYAFRKPFAAATYDGLNFAGTQVQLKTALVVGQIIGYTLAKFWGIKVVSESARAQRAWMLIGLVSLAELALLLFAVVPTDWKVAAILLNGVPLGFVWGLVVRYLEGRRTSDILLAGLACSFILASGVFKDVGRALLAGDTIPLVGIGLPNPFPPVTDFWMPAATGLLFLPPFLLAVWLLNQVPEPSLQDILARTEREPMDQQRRHQFLMLYLPGIALLVTGYLFLTTFRDYRDNYMVEVLNQLGYSYAQNKDIMSRMELGVALGVLATMGLLYLVKDNQQGLLVIFGVIVTGYLVIGIATLLHASGTISGFWWIALIGFGGYIAYVPYNSVLFDRLMASTKFVGTAVFAIYVADSAGYTGSILIQVGKDCFAAETSRMQFLQGFSIFLSLAGTLTAVMGGAYFWRRGKSSPPASEEES